MLAQADTDGSGVIDYTEFLAATLDKKVYVQVWLAQSSHRVYSGP